MSLGDVLSIGNAPPEKETKQANSDLLRWRGPPREPAFFAHDQASPDFHLILVVGTTKSRIMAFAEPGNVLGIAELSHIPALS